MTQEIDKIAYLYLKDGQILGTRSRGKAKFYIPGGKRDADETDEETLIREVQEELTVTLIPSTIDYVGTFTAQADGKPVGVMVKMTCYRAQYEGELAASNEIEELRWLTYADLDLVSHVDKKIFAYLKERGELL
ncbi:NUDIX hydrolase [Catalinimonas alkaloidigena]|nr:NUDIX domain-containing protein [Catalinimonas alkaloidigena]